MQTLWAWFFVLTIIFRFVPASLVARPIAALWRPTVAAPVALLPARARLALAWLAALGITFGTAFGVARPEVSPRGPARAPLTRAAGHRALRPYYLARGRVLLPVLRLLPLAQPRRRELVRPRPV